MASSPFVGLQVRLNLHSQPHSPITAKILSVNQSTNTLTVAKPDGQRIDIPRTDIASLSAINEAPKAGQAEPRPRPSTPKNRTASPAISNASRAAPATGAATSLCNEASTPSILFDQQRQQGDVGARGSPRPQPSPAPALTDPAIMSFSKPNRGSEGTARSRRAGTSRSNSPAITSAAAVAAPPPKLDDEFDFGAALAQFDKKKIWDEIRSADQTDPASLLVSHNRIAGGNTPLARGPNGVGPANQFSTPQRAGHAGGSGQQKLRPNEMVLSPSSSDDEEEASDSEDGEIEMALPVSSRQKAKVAEQRPPSTPQGQQRAPASKQPAAASTVSGKPSYEELEERIRKLEAELALAKRRNVLLEELAGLGLGGGGVAAAAAAAVPATPTPEPLVPTAASTPVTDDLSTRTAFLSLSASDGGAAPRNDEPTFGHILSPPLVTLLFPTAAAQHAALARMEAFYESSSSSHVYLSLAEAERERICRNYQGFNFPLDRGVQAWLAAMYAATRAATASGSGGGGEGEQRWWEPECSEAENEVLGFLVDSGVIDAREGWGGATPSTPGSGSGADVGRIRYLISTVAAKAHSTLAHERLHALFYLSPSYRSVVEGEFTSLSPGVKKVITHDLSLRGYAEGVYADEFQAYMCEGEGTEREFGNKAADECREAAKRLRAAVGRCWDEVGGQGGVERWEDVKWDVLRREERREKERRRAVKSSSSAGAGGGRKKGKGKGGR